MNTIPRAGYHTQVTVFSLSWVNITEKSYRCFDFIS